MPTKVYAQEKSAEKPQTGGSLILPPPEPSFGGVLGRKISESKPDFPKSVRAPEGAPNVLLIMTDDTGFGAASTFGGPIPTPALDRVAKSGLRYNQFHTTALCSPTRAALLTGRNHHSVGMGNITELATGYPGYTSIIPKSAATIGNILVDSGYNTAWFGKHHLVPEWMQGPSGPFDQWAIEHTNPLGKFSLDESFDAGQDTGTPVIDEYEAKMPFKFTGTLIKVEIKLGPDKLASNQRDELLRLQREQAIAAQ
jgi:Sulfatase